MTSSVRSRILRGVGATALGPVVTVLIQTISVPVFLHSWGPQLYGEWLILSAIPTYLALSDLGFGSVAGNDMTMRVAADDREGAVETFQGTWVLVTSLSLLFGLVVTTATLLPLNSWLNISSLSAEAVRTVVVLLCLYALVSLQGSLILAGFRCDGRFATGMLLINVTRLVEALAVTGAVALHTTPVHVAALMLFLRLGGSVTWALTMLAMIPWLRYGFRHATRRCIRALSRPAFAFMAFPAGNTLTIQGIVLVVGVMLGPIAVVTFSTMRTLTRFALQIGDPIRISVWPELSMAWGAQNWNLARRLHRRACQASLWLSISAIAVLWIAGPLVFRMWIHGRVVMDFATFHLLLLVLLANSFWNTSAVVALATNRHARVAVVYLCATVASLGVAALLTPSMYLPGVAVALLVTEFGTGCYVIRESMCLLQDSLVSFLRSLVNVRALAELRP